MPTFEIEEADDVFVPNAGAQYEFMRDFEHRFCALAGGWGIGKSWAGSRKSIMLHVHNAFDAAGEAIRSHFVNARAKSSAIFVRAFCALT